MRLLPLLCLAVLALPTPASAQEDACSQSAPCTWVVGVDGDGFDADDTLNATVGDWYVLDVLNLDDAPHTVTLEGYVSLQVPAVDGATSAPFQLDEAGTFSLDDDPSGDFRIVQVFETDVVDEESGADGDASAGEDSPLPVTLLFVALFAVAAVVRRR